MLEVGNHVTGRKKQSRVLLSHEPWELKYLVWEYIPAGAVPPRKLLESPDIKQSMIGCKDYSTKWNSYTNTYYASNDDEERGHEFEWKQGW